VASVTQRNWDDDERLLAEISRAVRESGPLARTIADQARDALSWLTVDEELLLASLGFDSSMEPVGETRGEAGDARILVFTSSALSMEVEVLDDQVVGQILPPGVGEVLVETPDGTGRRVSVDESGFFVLPALPKGPVRLRCDTPTGRVVTDWVQL
jgi:hypothetical protein